MRVLGIDPGSNATGFGVVECGAGRVRHVGHGVLRPPRGASLPQRLAYLHAGTVGIVEEHAPEVAAVERVFVAGNPRSVLVLGQARGVVLAALGGAGVPVSELAAREIKKAVAGAGGAAKAEVQAMVARILELERRPPSDAADALAAAICQAHAGKLLSLGWAGGSRRRRDLRSLGALTRRVR
jgi:crossover junction endodeoxyribonuclease RuvC